MVCLGLTSSTLAACTRVDTTDVHVRSAAAVGVVSEKNEWVLPPDGSPKEREVYRNPVATSTVTRSATGAIEYSDHYWALGQRADRTVLLDDQGRAHWVGTEATSKSLTDAVERGGEVRLHHVDWVLNSDSVGSNRPAMDLSLVTDSRNIDEIRVVRTPSRGLGVMEIILGAAAVGAGAADAALLLPSHPSEGRNVALGVGAGAVVLGGLAIANGLWRVLSREETITYRPRAGHSDQSAQTILPKSSFNH